MNRATRFHEYLQNGLEDVMSFYDYERFIQNNEPEDLGKPTRYTFYYDDRTGELKYLLRLTNPNLVNGYIIHLCLTLTPERLAHVRVLKEWSQTNGEIISKDEKLNDCMAKEGMV